MKTIRLLILLIPSIWVASCTNEDNIFPSDPQNDDKKEITFQIDITEADWESPETRIATSPYDYTCSWNDGDKIGLYITTADNSLQPSGNYIDNIEITYSGGKWTPAIPLYCPANSQKVNFYAYYPYDAQMANPLHYEYKVSTDQGSNKDLGKSDFLWVKQENKPIINNSVDLQFSHALALIKIEVGWRSEYTLDVTSYMQEVVTDCTINLGEQTIITGNKKENIMMWHCFSQLGYPNRRQFMAIMPPQTLVPVFLHWDDNPQANPFTSTTGSNVIFEIGKMKKYIVD